MKAFVSFFLARYPRDRIDRSIFQVGLLFLADTLNSVFNMWWIYNVLINNYGTVVVFLRFPKQTFSLAPATQGISQPSRTLIGVSFRTVTGYLFRTDSDVSLPQCSSQVSAPPPINGANHDPIIACYRGSVGGEFGSAVFRTGTGG